MCFVQLLLKGVKKKSNCSQFSSHRLVLHSPPLSSTLLHSPQLEDTSLTSWPPELCPHWRISMHQWWPALAGPKFHIFTLSLIFPQTFSIGHTSNNLGHCCTSWLKLSLAVDNASAHMLIEAGSTCLIASPSGYRSSTARAA